MRATPDLGGHNTIGGRIVTVFASMNDSILIGKTVCVFSLGLFPKVVSPKKGEDENECDHTTRHAGHESGGKRR